MKHPNRGGPRPNSGRLTNEELGLPPPKRKTSVTLSVEVFEWLNAQPGKNSPIIEAALREWMRKR